MGKTSSQELTNITTSEGNLKRLSEICSVFGDEHRITNRKFNSKIKRETKLTNERVINRHLNILKKLGFLERTEDWVNLTNEGKALQRYLIERNTPNQLSNFEKLIFLRQMLSTVKYQLFNLLDLINNQRSTEKILSSYYEANPAKNQRSLKNRVDVFTKWFISLGLLKKEGKILELTPQGKRIYNAFNETNEVLTLLAYFSNAEEILDTEELLNELYENVLRHRGKTRGINFYPIRIIFQLTQLEKRILITAEQIDDLLRRLTDEGKITSIILGRDGFLSTVVI